MSEVKKLYDKLEEMGGSIGGITLGFGNPTPDEVAAEIRRSLEELEAGNFEVIADIGYLD